jgi:hypothetical protein
MSDGIFFVLAFHYYAAATVHRPPDCGYLNAANV